MARLSHFSTLRVALRKESVDRNVDVLFQLVGGVASLSARRAWIEIMRWVAARINTIGRSPQGERG